MDQDASENPAEFEEEFTDIDDILHQLDVNIDRLSISKFKICRSDIFGRVSRGMTKKFSPSKKAFVKFTDDIGRSEGAVYLGGPIREFFTLAVEKV